MKKNALISKGKADSHTDSTVQDIIDRNAELERVLRLVRHDLLLRAEVDDDGVKVVDLGSSVWNSLNGALSLSNRAWVPDFDIIAMSLYHVPPNVK
jgi:hypothetical protein